MVVEGPPGRLARLTLRAIGIGFLATLAGTVLALLTSQLQGAGVAIFILSVTIAAVSGGLWAGVVAALLASIALPIVESPQRVFGFEQLRDLIAAVVFLAIAVVVGLVVGNAADERDRASRREREARLLAFLSAKLLSGDVPDRVLDEFVQVLLEPLGLASCQVSVTLDGQEIEAKAVRPGVPRGGPTEVIPVVVSAETNQLRAAMFSSVTHDLRTPLASIKAGVTSLLDASAIHDALQQRELLTTILEETDRLNRLVGNILDLAKIRAGALIPKRVPTAVDEVAEAVVARMRPLLADFAVELQLAPDLPEVPADPVQLDQVLTNLLENAARHSPRGGTIRIHVSQTRDAVRVRVSDEGPGIKPEEREKVFEAFYRGRESPESSGSGLGLAIARAVVTAHGGRIRIEETTGGGTAMVVDVPLEETVL
ncbi:MAG: DUF4118 domain-containing protein [Actinobacteria bacterium]|nr:MAG: DUF4118 domain-containing protein [Actinomycetota bacterium]